MRGPHSPARVRFDSNKYSVSASAVGRPVEIRAYAERIELRQDGRVVGEHRRVFGRGQTVYNPAGASRRRLRLQRSPRQQAWEGHYVPVLARKPGALRNGAPFKDPPRACCARSLQESDRSSADDRWVLPASLERVRRKLRAPAGPWGPRTPRGPGGDRQMVDILSVVLTDGLAAVEAACTLMRGLRGPRTPQEALAEGVHSADVILNILARRRDPGPALTITTPDALRLGHEPVADCCRYNSLIRAQAAHGA